MTLGSVRESHMLLGLVLSLTGFKIDPIDRTFSRCPRSCTTIVLATCGSTFQYIYVFWIRQARTTENISGRIGFTSATLTFPCPFYRWHCLLLSLLELLVSSSCIGGVANVTGVIFLQGQRSSLWSETFFQCPPESNGRRMQSGEKNTVCVW